jgi:hypothetical protein
LRDRASAPPNAWGVDWTAVVIFVRSAQPNVEHCSWARYSVSRCASKRVRQQ